MILNMKNKMRQTLKKTQALLSRYSRAKDGTATIEFVFIAPVMIFLYVGLYEVSIAFLVNGTVNNSSDVASSFPTFEETLDEIKLENIMTASAAVVNYPNFNIQNLAIDIYSIEQVDDTASSRRLVGQASYEGGNADGILPNLTINDFLTQNTSLEAGKGFIVAQVAYKYEPSISSRYVQTVTLVDRKTLNPRENDGNALNITTTSGQERAILNCTPNEVGVFSCSFTSQFPES